MKRISKVLRALTQVWVSFFGAAIRAVFLEIGDILSTAANIIRGVGQSVWTSAAIIHMAIGEAETTPEAKAAMPAWYVEAMSVRADGQAPLPEEPNG